MSDEKKPNTLGNIALNDIIIQQPDAIEAYVNQETGDGEVKFLYMQNPSDYCDAYKEIASKLRKCD